MGTIRSLLLLILIAAPTTAAAAEEPLALVQALERAIAGNPDLRRDRLTIELRDAGIQAAQGQFDFRLTSNLTFSRSTTPAISGSDLQGGFTNNLALNLGLARALESGGSLRLSVQDNASNTNARLQCGNSGADQSTCTFYNSGLSLNFTHPLLRGFGSEVAQANIRRNRVQKDQALLNRQMRASNVMRDVVNGYWELAYATQDLAIQRSAVELAREQLRITQAQIEVGRLAPVDAAAVERAIGDRMQTVVASEQTLYFRTLDLRRLFGLAADPEAAAFAASDAPLASPRDVQVAAEVRHALDVNPQLRALKLGIKLSELDLATARSTLLPQLDFVGDVGSTGKKLARDRVEASAFSDAFKQAAGLDNLVWSAGLRLDVPLENRVAKGQMRAAQVGEASARLESGDFELEIRNQVLRLATMVRSASRRVELAKATVGFATQNLEAEKARFTVGRSTNNDVLLRQQELKSAEISVVRATVDLLESETTLAAITGELLERYGVVLKGL